MLHSAAQNDVHLRVLNWGGQHLGFGDKFLASLNYISTLPPCDLVVFADAYDVLYAHPPEHVKQQLLGRDPDGTRGLLVSAECGCWPLAMKSDGSRLCHEYYPDSPTPSK